MKYCPQCGKLLNHTIKIEDREVKQCSCGYIDWDNWVNVSAVTIPYTAEGNIMMVRMKRTGKLTFPGGYRNLGETIKEAAIRECFEETGYHIDNLRLFDVFTLDKLRLVWIVFKASIINGSFIDNDEVSEVVFVSPDHLIEDEALRGSLTIELYHKLCHKDK